MLGRKHGLIVKYVVGRRDPLYFHVPFGVQKSGVDRMARDMAHELKPYGIAAVSIWPGYIKSEKLAAQPIAFPRHSPNSLPREAKLRSSSDVRSQAWLTIRM